MRALSMAVLTAVVIGVTPTLWDHGSSSAFEMLGGLWVIVGLGWFSVYADRGS